MCTIHSEAGVCHKMRVRGVSRAHMLLEHFEIVRDLLDSELRAVSEPTHDVTAAPNEATQPTEKPADTFTAAARGGNKHYRIRHSASHIMAQAVLEMFPDASLAIGPPIADGFYYDFDLPRSLADDDLVEIEARMRRIIKGNFPFTRTQMTKPEALAYFSARNQAYKLELIDGIADPDVSIYTQDVFTDLCAGPHVARTGDCKHFKLLSVAGAYWRGDSTKPMLQRIYGTAWPTAKELETYLAVREEAKKRDHRRLGKQLDLFSFHPYAPGAPFWHPKGVTLYDLIVKMARDEQKRRGYIEIRNPLIYDSELYKISGHLEHYAKNMFTLESEGRCFCVKPMNCPDTMLFFKNRQRSYRDLPMRVAETQILHRNELSGAMSGLTRVRQFTQDDAHIFASIDQIEAEIADLVDMLDTTYKVFDLDFRFFVSTRPDDFMGEPSLWDTAEAALKGALDKVGRPYKLNEKDGAFYGPKIDVCIRDSLGRQWQCATFQLDFQLPQRFELEYVGADNKMHCPVVIHRAVFGSFERFIGIMIEHLAGAFPTWLAPVQAVFLPITDTFNDYCKAIAAEWTALGVRVEVDDRSEKVGYKISEAERSKIPYMLVVGQKEADAGLLNVRAYGDSKLGADGTFTNNTRRPMTPADVLAEIQLKVATKALDVPMRKLDLELLSGKDEDEAPPPIY
jgi:threonyl-tRNA synthetase